MNKTVLVLSLMVILFTPIIVIADTSSPPEDSLNYHFRLLFHGSQLLEGSNRFGLAGWVIAPDVTSKPNKWLGIFGPRFEERGFHVEVMTGCRIEQGKGVPLLDLRSGISPQFFGNFTKKKIPLALWTNIQWIDVSGSNDLYVYFETNVILPYGLPAIGGETENILFLPGQDIVSMGGHMIFALGKMKIAGVYQAHRKTTDQVWLRMIVNF